MKNILKRLILFFFALPLLMTLMIFVPHYQYVWIMGVLTIIGFKCGLEMRNMLGRIDHHLPLWSIVFPGLAPVLSWLTYRGILPVELSVLALFLGVSWAFSNAALASKSHLSNGFHRIGIRLVMALYPGFFLWWIQAVASTTSIPLSPLVFTLAIYLNDSASWLIGMLFGKHRGLVAVSPNKSLEGFIAGIFASIIVIVLSSRYIPNCFSYPLWQLLLFGTVLGFASILGDLSESALKRATGVKDSGRIILGRGGMLDSIDSMFFTAPIFVLFAEMGEWAGV